MLSTQKVKKNFFSSTNVTVRVFHWLLPYVSFLLEKYVIKYSEEARVEEILRRRWNFPTQYPSFCLTFPGGQAQAYTFLSCLFLLVSPHTIKMIDIRFTFLILIIYSNFLSPFQLSNDSIFSSFNV